MAVMVELPKANTASNAVEHRAKMYRLRKPVSYTHLTLPTTSRV